MSNTGIPFYQLFDNEGAPLAGASVYSYLAGTSTPKPTYTDHTLSVANPNPMILDAAGRARVFYGSGIYKFVLKDALGVTLDTIDYVECDNNGSSVAIPSPTVGVLEYDGTSLRWNNTYLKQSDLDTYIDSKKNIPNGIVGLDGDTKFNWSLIDFTNITADKVGGIKNFNETPSIGKYDTLPTTGTIETGAIAIMDDVLYRYNGSIWVQLNKSNLPADALGYLHNDGAGNLTWGTETSTFKQKYIFTASNQYTNIGAGSDPYGNTVMFSKNVAVNGNPPSNFPILNYYDTSSTGTLDMWFTPVGLDVKYWLFTCVAAAVVQSSVGTDPVAVGFVKVFDSTGALYTTTMVPFHIPPANVNIKNNLTVDAYTSIRLDVNNAFGPFSIPAMSYFGMYINLGRGTDNDINAIKNCMVGIEATEV